MATETTLRPGELKEVLLKEIQSADLTSVDMTVKDEGRVYSLTLSHVRAMRACFVH